MYIKINCIILLSLAASVSYGSEAKPPLAPAAKIFVMTSSCTTSSDKMFSPLTAEHKSCDLCCAQKRRESTASASSVSPITVFSVPSPIQNPK